MSSELRFIKSVSSAVLRCGFFSEKNIEKKYLCRHDKNYYDFWKSNIAVINLIVDYRNMIKVSKIWVCKKLDKWWESFSPNTNNFLAFFIVFEWNRILESAMDKQEVICNAKLYPNYFSVNVSVIAVAFRRQFSANQQFCLKLSVFLKLSAKYNS